MTAFGIVILQTCCCLGFGAFALRILGIQKELPIYEQWTWSFAVGFGLLGWLLFFFGVVGWFSTVPLFIVIGFGACGIVVLFLQPPQPDTGTTPENLDIWFWLLLAAILFVALFDLLEGLSPPADGDTLAYHFAFPKQLLAIGKLEFVPRAGDGAVPLLVHMTYATVLGLGGERALTLWVMISGWGTVSLFYVIARRYLDLRWSLMISLIFMSTPAILYGAGGGQVEVRNASFAIVAAFAISQAVKTGYLRYAALAGLAVGFFMGAKYLGLIFAVACGSALLFQKRWLTHSLIFFCMALIAGGQWYVWNYIHTGDPVYPTLSGILEYSQNSLWDAENAASFQLVLKLERPLPNNVFWFFAYPFASTLANIKGLESTRTGLGPFLLLIVPFVLAGVWTFRDHIIRHSLFPIIVIAIVFYAMWFFIGSPQRIRHLLPIYPLVLIVLTVTAHRWADTKCFSWLLSVAALLTLSIQLAIQTVYGLNYARHVFGGESRQHYFIRNISGYTPVPWINSHLKQSEKIYFTARPLAYLFNVPAFYGHWALEPRVKANTSTGNPKRFYRQIAAQGVTHLLVYGPLPKISKQTQYINGLALWKPLFNASCAESVKSFRVSIFGSRTLSAATAKHGQAHVLKLNTEQCNQWLKR